MADITDGFLSENIVNPALVKYWNNLGFKPSGANMTFEEAMTCAMINQAINGDTKAFQQVMESVKKRKGMPLEDFVRENVTDKE